MDELSFVEETSKRVATEFHYYFLMAFAETGKHWIAMKSEAGDASARPSVCLRLDSGRNEPLPRFVGHRCEVG